MKNLSLIILGAMSVPMVQQTMPSARYSTASMNSQPETVQLGFTDTYTVPPGKKLCIREIFSLPVVRSTHLSDKRGYINFDADGIYHWLPFTNEYREHSQSSPWTMNNSITWKYGKEFPSGTVITMDEVDVNNPGLPSGQIMTCVLLDE